MIAVRRTGLRGALLATAVASSVMVAPSAFAAGSDTTFNNAEATLRGGDGVAVALCVNWAQDWAKKSAKDKEKYDKKRAAQANVCGNTLIVEGGSVELDHVYVKVDQGGKHKATRNNAAVTLKGGDATALAACINVLNGSTAADQSNECGNENLVIGGSVIVTNTTVTVHQQ
jgi:hypothetical protein